MLKIHDMSRFPLFARWAMFSFAITHMPRNERHIYLTFDDGPHPSITPDVMQILDQYAVKATFFCVGENIQTYPEIFQLLKNKGHGVGNHSFSHRNGWKTTNAEYLSDIKACENFTKTGLFRPPYGKLSISQAKILSRHYRIVLWSLLSRDYDESLLSEKILRTLLSRTKSGDIIVFHDSAKAFPRMIQVLPFYLEAMLEKGFTFDVIPPRI